MNQGNNPFGKSIAQSIEKTNKVIKGDFTQDNIIDLELLEDDELEANAFISKTQNRSLLRKIVDPETKERIYDRNSDTLDGLPVVNLKSSNLKRGELITGDFDKLIYGIPQLVNTKSMKLHNYLQLKRRWHTCKLIRTRYGGITCNYACSIAYR